MSETQVEKSRREAREQAQKTHVTMHRALDRKYNLLRVSERRWRVVRVSSIAELLHDEADVITFEHVTAPLAFEAARAALRDYRAAAKW